MVYVIVAMNIVKDATMMAKRVYNVDIIYIYIMVHAWNSALKIMLKN